MGAKNSKVKKGEKKGAAAGDESSDQVDKTATLPASFKKKEVETGGKTETLPRNLNRSTSFTNSCRNWAKKKGLVKDKSPNSKDENETPTKTSQEEVKENGTRKSETKEVITPVVAKLAQKKARAQFFEDMYNSSGISVSSSLTPEKPKRLCDMNLPSPRIGPGSPTMDKPKVEQIVEMIEEKEKLNRSIDSEANSSLNRSMEAPAKEVVVVPAEEANNDNGSNMIADAVIPKEEISEEANIEVKEDLIQAAKEETEDVIETIEELQEVLEEKKNIDELQEILEDNDIAGGEEDEKDVANDKAWEEAKEEMLENVEATMDETLPSTARLQPEEPSMQTLEEAKEEVEEVGEVKEDVDDKQCSLEKEEEEETKVMDNGDLGENVITGSGEAGEQSSEEEDLVKEEEESCREEKQAGALGLRRELESGEEKENEEEEEKEEEKGESTGVDGN